MRSFRNWLIGFLTAVLAALGLVVMADDANLNWTAPTENTDGSPLTDLAGFKVYRGDLGGPYTEIADITDPAQTTYLDSGLADGTYCYVVTAYDTSNNESAYSNEACKVIDTILPRSITDLTVS